jgi:hypothetical protein
MPVGACAIRHRRPVDGRRQISLAGPERSVRKGEAAERRVARAAVLQLLRGPGDKPLALHDEMLAQRIGRMRFDEHRFLLARDVEIDERHANLRETELAAQQPAVDAGLRPVQFPVIGRHRVEPAAMRLDLFELVRRGIVPVGAAAHAKRAVVAGERDFGQVAGSAPRRHGRMARHAFLRGGRWREAQVEVAALRREFAQRAHRDDVARRAPVRGGFIDGRIACCMHVQYSSTR